MINLDNLLSILDEKSVFYIRDKSTYILDGPFTISTAYQFGFNKYAKVIEISTLNDTFLDHFEIYIDSDKCDSKEFITIQDIFDITSECDIVSIYGEDGISLRDSAAQIIMRDRYKNNSIPVKSIRCNTVGYNFVVDAIYSMDHSRMITNPANRIRNTIYDMITGKYTPNYVRGKNSTDAINQSTRWIDYSKTSIKASYDTEFCFGKYTNAEKAYEFCKYIAYNFSEDIAIKILSTHEAEVSIIYASLYSENIWNTDRDDNYPTFKEVYYTLCKTMYDIFYNRPNASFEIGIEGIINSGYIIVINDIPMPTPKKKKQEDNTPASKPKTTSKKKSKPKTIKSTSSKHKTAEKEPKKISTTPWTDTHILIDPSCIDMSDVDGLDDPNFWNHHGNNYDTYINMASMVPKVINLLNEKNTLTKIRSDMQYRSTVMAYFQTANMVIVREDSPGVYKFTGDGRHRILAAIECGIFIPVRVMDKKGNITHKKTSESIILACPAVHPITKLSRIVCDEDGNCRCTMCNKKFSIGINKSHRNSNNTIIKILMDPKFNIDTLDCASILKEIYLEDLF